MAKPSINTLVSAVRTKDWSAANESFGGIMQQKVADVLSGVKKTIFKEEHPAVDAMNKEVEAKQRKKDEDDAAQDTSAKLHRGGLAKESKK